MRWNEIVPVGIGGKQAEGNVEAVSVETAKGVQEHHIGAGGAFRVDDGEDSYLVRAEKGS